MDPETREKLRNRAFVIYWDEGEQYYQVHRFENADGSRFLHLSSKTNQEGKIELFVRASKGVPIFATLEAPIVKEEFDKMIEFLKNTFEEMMGFSHYFIDLSSCTTPMEAMSFLKKTDPRFEIEIRHKSDA